MVSRGLTGHLMLSSPHLQFISCIKKKDSQNALNTFSVSLLRAESPADITLMNRTKMTQAPPNGKCLQTSPFVAKMEI